MAESRGFVQHGAGVLRQQVRLARPPQTFGAAQERRVSQTARLLPPLRQKLQPRHPAGTRFFFFLIHSARSAVTLLETHTSMAGSAKSIGTTCQYRSMNFAYANVEQMVIVMAEK